MTRQTERRAWLSIALCAILLTTITGATARAQSQPSQPPASATSEPAQSQPMQTQGAGLPNAQQGGPAVRQAPAPAATHTGAGNYWTWVGVVVAAAIFAWIIVRLGRHRSIRRR